MIRQPYVAQYGSFILLPDKITSSKRNCFIDSWSEVGTNLELISGGYNCVLQPCDVGSMRSFESGIRKRYMKWASSTYINLEIQAPLPMAARTNILKWASQSFNAIPMDCLQNKFRHTEFSTNALSPSQTPCLITYFPYFVNSIVIMWKVMVS